METKGVRDGLLAASRATERPVYVSDAGDNTTAGAPGDLTCVLQEALKLPEIDDAVILGIFAPEAVRLCLTAGVGADIFLDLGREHVSGQRRIKTVNAIIEAAGNQLRLGGFQPYRSIEGAWARVRIGKVLATIHDAPIGIATPAHLEAMGINPCIHKIYVVKLGYLHPQLEDVAARHILLTSDGSSQLDMRRLDWHRIIRPAHPLDSDIEWAPEQSTYSNSTEGSR
jgi:microcystin degradation protein MlrC